MDMDQLAELVERLVTTQNNSNEQADQRQRELVQQFMIGRPDAAAIRAEKISKLGIALRKSTKLEDYKEDGIPIKEWLRRYSLELTSLRVLQGLPDDLTREENISIIKDMLDFSVIERLDLVFRSRDPVITWADVQLDVLTAILKEEFGPKVSQVGQVLQQFGPQRVKKTENMTVASFTHKWTEQLPECMCPTSDDERLSFVDLIKKTMFYLSVNDAYIQKELCDMPGEPTFKQYFDQAVLAEQKRNSFNDIGDSKAHLEPEDLQSLDDQSDDGSVLVKYSAQKYGGRARGRGWRSQQQQRDGRQDSAQDSYNGQGSQGSSRGPGSISDHSAGRGQYGRGRGRGHRGRTATGQIVCYRCGKVGHIAAKCRVSMVNNSESAPAEVMVKEEVEEDQVEESMLNVDFLRSALGGEPQPPTCKNIFTSLRFNGNKKVRMECDTAASHNMLSLKTYKKIWPYKGPRLVKKDVTVLMADGTKSALPISSMKCMVTASNNKSVLLHFYVLDGPHNLLGRFGLKTIWPKEYHALQKVAEVPLKPEISEVQVGPSLRCSAGDGRPVSEQPDRRSTGDGWPVSERPDTGNLRGSTGEGRPVSERPDRRSAGEGRPVPEQSDGDSTAVRIPPRRKAPPIPEGVITQKMGKEYCKKLCKLYGEVFDGKKGQFKGVQAELFIKEGHEEALKKKGVRPPARVPHGLIDEYDEKLDKMLENMTQVNGHEITVASQIVPVCETVNGKKKLKRLAVNYKSTINEHLEDIPQLPIVCTDELDKLKGQYRSVIDMSGAFQQIELAPGRSRRICAIVTPRGYFVPHDMQFGIKVAPAIWNSNMKQLLQGFNGKGPVKAGCVVDDICVTGDTPQEHFANLQEVLYRLYAAGLKANVAKCKFYEDEVKFLGKIVDHQGIRLDTKTIEPIMKMVEPSEKSGLRSFLGHMSYIARHCPDMRKARSPLDELLKADVKWVWEEKHQQAFDTCKRLAGNAAKLVHYDPSKPLVLTTDASPFGVGACLSHKVIDANGRKKLLPIAYASASLKQSEKAYAQIDREGLAVYWAVNYFRQYLWGKRFELHTDCSALVKIFGPKHDMGGCAIGRLNRWAAQLTEYDFVIKHIKGTSNCVADSLSRLPVPMDKSGARYPDGRLQELGDLPQVCKLQADQSENEIMVTVKWLAERSHQECEMTVNQVVGNISGVGGPWDMVPLTCVDVAKATREDPVYGKLVRAIRSGVLNKSDKELQKFAGVFDQLYLEEEVIYFGSRIVIPTKQQARMMDELHMSHIGIGKMKNVSRRYFWWPGITKSVEETARKCKECVKFRKRPDKQAVCPWPYARRPMERVHIDFMEYRGQMILIMVDAFSKKIWASNMGLNTTSLKTLSVLYEWFCGENGFPTTLVSDNGPQLVSEVFERVVARWGVKHLLSPPYHPASNGLAERAVGIVKGRLKKMNASAGPISLKVTLQYICKVHGLTPNDSTGRCPFELIKEGPTPSLFPQLTKSLQKTSELTAVRQSLKGAGKRRLFWKGQSVIVYDFKTKKSSHGLVKEVLGNNTYTVACETGLKHVSGDALSKSDIEFEELQGESRLTAQEEPSIVQDLQEEPQTRVYDSDSSDDDEPDHGLGFGYMPPQPVLRRRVRDLGLGPTVPNRLRQRH